MSLLKARPGLHCAPVSTGVYFADGRTKFVVKGPPVLAKVAELCVPLLEQGTTEQDILAALGNPSAAPAARGLVDALRSKGALLDTSAFTVQAPDSTTAGRYSAILGYLETWSDDPYRAFEAIRTARIQVCGPAAAVLPAARGLVAAGVPHVFLVTEDCAEATPVLRRLAEVSAAVPSHVDARIVVGDAMPDSPAPARESVVVRHLRTVITVGGSERFALRAEAWAEASERAATPTGLALAGAVAAQMVLDAIAGVGSRDTARVIYRRTLAMDTVTTSGVVLTSSEPLADCTASPALPAEELAELLAPISRPWTGLLHVEIPADLPQLPLVMASARASRDAAPAIGWGTEIGSATMQAALSCLRDQAVLLDPAGTGIAAAGISSDRWLLDGALRRLADRTAGFITLSYSDLDNRQSRRLWRALEDYELRPITAELHDVDGLSWVLATVRDQRDHAVLATAWGASAEDALRQGLGDALTRAQYQRARTADSLGGSLSTAALTNADASTIAKLLDEVDAVFFHRGNRLRGQRIVADGVLDDIPVFFGRVRFDGRG